MISDKLVSYGSWYWPSARLGRTFLLSLAAHAIALSLLAFAPQALVLSTSAPVVRAEIVTRETASDKASDKGSISPVEPLVPAITPRVAGLRSAPSLPRGSAVLRNTPSLAIAPRIAHEENVVPPQGDSRSFADNSSSKDVSAQAIADAMDSFSAEGLRTYRLALGREARRLKLEYDRKYSRFEQDIEGRVEMKVRTNIGGAIVLLARSSGYAMLDEQAMELIGRAVRQTPLPAALQGRELLLPIALEFEISRQ